MTENWPEETASWNDTDVPYDDDHTHNTVPDNTSLPLYERLRLLEESKQLKAYDSTGGHKKRKVERTAITSNDADMFSHKNAPATMPSNKPVKRYWFSYVVLYCCYVSVLNIDYELMRIMPQHNTETHGFLMLVVS